MLSMWFDGSMTTTREQAAITMCREVLGRHNLTSWHVQLDNAVSRTGLASSSRRTISLSRHFIRLNEPERWMQTILHEVAHAIVGTSHGHDRIWRAKLLEIGGDGRRTSSTKTTNVVPAKWIATCSCGNVFKRMRLTYSMRWTSGCPCGKHLEWRENTPQNA